MNYNKKNFILNILLVALLIVLFSRCNINEILNEDDNKKVDENTTEIGADGGTITKDDLTITIPAGSFSQTANIKITQAGNNYSEENIVTPIYSIEGLPENYSLPIEVAIKLSDTTSNDTYLLIQEEYFVSSLGGVRESNIYFDASIDGSLLKGQIPAILDDPAKISSSNIRYNTNSLAGVFSFNIFGSSNKKIYITGNNHFKIIYDASKDNLTDITNLGMALEIAYGKIKDIGFSYSRRTNWPVAVYIGSLENAHGLFTASKWSINNGCITFDRGGLSDQEEVKTTAIHEFFHLVQYLYDYRGAFRQGSFAPDHYWFNEACSVWSEELVVNSEYESSNWLSNQLRPFNGFQAGSVDNPEKHGYGMAAFVKFLVGKYGNNILVGIYDNLLNHKHVIDAINSSANSMLFMDCSSFFKRYSRGLIYPSFGPGNFFNIVDGKFDIKSESDTLKTFTANYTDLSAKVYLVKLENPYFHIDDSLEISIDQDLCDITVFKHPFPGTQIIAEGQRSCIIRGLKDLYQEHKQLYVMVTNTNFISNNYQPSNLGINLKIKLLSHKLKGISVRLKLADYQFRRCDSTGCEDITWRVSDPAFYFSSGLYGGSWNLNGNVFTGNIDNPFPDAQTVSGTMVITFLENPSRVNVVINADLESLPSSVKSWTKHLQLEINEIPGTGLSYSESGQAISRINFVYKMNSKSPTTGEISEEYLNSSFNWESDINVNLIK